MTNEYSLELGWLRQRYEFGSLVDIGANDGAYGAFLQAFFDIQEVHAFEPQVKFKSQLAGRGFEVYDFALSDSSGACQFYTSQYDPASSLLPLTAMAVTEWPEISTNTAVEVETRRLDDALGCLSGEVLIKVDAQGSEDRIIRGGERVFASAAAILIEMSFVPIYADQALFGDVHHHLSRLGFALRGFKSQYTSARSGEPLFAHCVYEKAHVGK